MASPIPAGAFQPQDIFIETAFERRFQGLLRAAQRQRSWHVIGAVPGSGKSFGIADLVVGAQPSKTAGSTCLPILAVRSPKNNKAERALGVALAGCYGQVPTMPWDLLRSWLVAQAARAAVELIVVDDAHDLSLAHLSYLKELTDNLAAPPYSRRVGLCLVAAARSGTVPFKEILARDEPLWRQFRRRLDTERPYCTVLGHTEEELREICYALQQEYMPQFGALNLMRWRGSIYRWLTHETLDPERSGRVAMDNLARLVLHALHTAHALGLDDVSDEILTATADLMTLRRDEITPIDGEPDEIPPVTERLVG